VRAALQLNQALLPDQVRVLGADHPDTLTTRNNIADWTGQCGEAARGAAALPGAAARSGARARRRSSGHAHDPQQHRRLDRRVRRGAPALQLFQAVLPDQVRVLGADHPDTLTTRNNIAGWTGACGEARAALQLFQALLPDQVRVLGADHPNTLNTLDWIRSLTPD